MWFDGGRDVRGLAVGVRLIGALGLTALAVAGCGSGGSGGSTESAKNFSGEKQKAAQVVEDFESGIHDGDAKRICDQVLSKRNRPANCESDLKAFVGQAQNKKVDLEVKGVALRGDRAKARVRISGGPTGGQTVTYPLAKEHGEWRITAAQG
jgi:hypothetical protein